MQSFLRTLHLVHLKYWYTERSILILLFSSAYSSSTLPLISLGLLNPCIWASQLHITAWWISPWMLYTYGTQIWKYLLSPKTVTVLRVLFTSGGDTISHPITQSTSVEVILHFPFSWTPFPLSLFPYPTHHYPYSINNYNFLTNLCSSSCVLYKLWYVHEFSTHKVWLFYLCHYPTNK